MAYNRINWRAKPSTATPITPENLNIMDKGIADLESQLQQTATKQELTVVDAKVDNILALPEDTTINDARLEDINVAYNGKIYDNPGNAVRGQIGEIYETIDDKFSVDLSVNRYDTTKVLSNHTIHATTGLPFETTNLYLSDFIDIEVSKSYSFYQLESGKIVNPSIPRYAYYDINKNVLTIHSNVFNRNLNGNNSPITPNASAKYIRFVVSGGTFSLGNIMLCEYSGTIPSAIIPYDRKVYLRENVKLSKSQIIDLEEDEAEEDVISPILPNTIYAIAGTSLNIYWRNIFAQSRDAMRCYAHGTGSKGMNYPRAYHYDANASDSEFALKLKYCDEFGKNQGEKNITIKPVAPSPKVVNILPIGDSFTFIGQWQSGLYDLLVASGYTPNFIGRNLFDTKQKSESRGGGTMAHYTSNTAGGRVIKIKPQDLNTKISSSAKYQDGNGNVFEVWAHNENMVEIFNWSINAIDINIPASGTLQKISGTGPNTITYTEILSRGASANPFWNIVSGKLDFQKYVNDNGFASPNVCILQFMLNDIRPWSTDANIDAAINNYKTFIDALYVDYPNCKVIISIEPMGSAKNAGITTGEQNDINGAVFAQMKFCKRMIELFNESGSYGGYVRIAPSYAQVDLENGYPISQVSLSSRITVDETFSTDSIHCTQGGMLQISDAVFPVVVKLTN